MTGPRTQAAPARSISRLHCTNGFATALRTAERIALASAQKIDLSITARYARSWIAGAVAFAGGVGATPIPLADAALLVPRRLP
jgi:hypothetical protein